MMTLLEVSRYLGLVAGWLLSLPFLFALVVGFGGTVLFGAAIIWLSEWEPRR